MLASLVSFAGRLLGAVGRVASVRRPALRWKDEGGARVAVWTAPDAAGPGVATIRIEIVPTDASRLPFAVRVCPEGYVTRSFLVGDLEVAHSTALEQLALARALPAIAAGHPSDAGPGAANEDAPPARSAAVSQPRAIPGAAA